ncbi:MAG: EF-hand domain-containing protein [Nitrosomonas sp.]|nr:EF-hand domain-containing protein [Nitrosomonas sp.]
MFLSITVLIAITTAQPFVPIFIQNRSDLLPCFHQYFDLDHNNAVNASEIEIVLNQTGLVNFNGTIIIENCDQNNDGVLTEQGDWYNATSCLLYPSVSVFGQTVTSICKRLGWVNPAPPMK